MQRDKVKAAILEATRFINKATEMLAQTAHDPLWTAPKLTGATRRASMDLTRALADMRRAGC